MDYLEFAVGVAIILMAAYLRYFAGLQTGLYWLSAYSLSDTRGKGERMTQIRTLPTFKFPISRYRH